MKHTHSFVLALCAFTALVPLAATRQAASQTSSNSSIATTFNTWDPAAVISVSGSIESVVSHPAAGVPGGSNILVNSTQGEFYANLGPHLGAQLSQQLTSGQFVTLSGIVHTFNGNKYILVRTLNLNGQTFVIRNAHGFPMKNISTTTQSVRIRQGSFGGAR